MLNRLGGFGRPVAFREYSNETGNVLRSDGDGHGRNNSR